MHRRVTPSADSVISWRVTPRCAGTVDNRLQGQAQALQHEMAPQPQTDSQPQAVQGCDDFAVMRVAGDCAAQQRGKAEHGTAYEISAVEGGLQACGKANKPAGPWPSSQ
eukprot:jgi/Ulvmu1/9015/UM005_0106.1